MTTTTGWRKKLIMNKQQEQMEKLDPLDVVKIVVEALDDAYAAGIRNSSKREWVHATEWRGLTDEDWEYLNENCGSIRSAVKTAETLLKEKNTNA